MKSIKKIFVVFLIANFMMFTLTGCFHKQNIVAVINDEQIAEPLYRIFLWQTQQGMESLIPNIWKLDNLGGKSPEEVAKERALDSISYYVVAEEKAKELGIKLNKEEKNEVKTSAKEAVKNNEIINEKYNIKQKDYEAFYTYMKIREKLLDALGESYEPSEEEIAGLLKEEATIIQVFINTKDELGNDLPSDKKQEAYEIAQKVLSEALAGADLSELAMKYSDDPSVNENQGLYSFIQGQLDKNLEAVIFDKAIEGEVYPKVIDVANGYEIVKVVEKTNGGSEASREGVIMQLKEEYAMNELLDIAKFAKIELKESYNNVGLMTIDESEE